MVMYKSYRQSQYYYAPTTIFLHNECFGLVDSTEIYSAACRNKSIDNITNRVSSVATTISFLEAKLIAVSQ